jgi:Xaa-Pro aminopeptidase
MERIPDGIAVIPGATAPGASVPFRQNNDFLYLTGVEAPGAWLVVDGVARESTLFLTLDERGAREQGLPLELAGDPRRATGIEHALAVEQLLGQLDILQQRTPVLYAPFRPQELPRVSSREQDQAWRRAVTDDPLDGRLTRQRQLVVRLRERYPGAEVRDASPLLWELRKIKSPAEVALVRRAAQLSVQGHLELMRSAGPGVAEHELAALFELVCRRGGAQDLAYATILMSGPHHPFGHYHRHDRVLEAGDFVILDAGADFASYDADVSTSFPADGVFSARQRELYELALGVHGVCLASYRPGTTLREVGQRVAWHLQERGHDPSEPRFRGLVTWGGYNHPIGMATHDVVETVTGPDEALRPGFVFACDVNMPVDERLGVRIEDTVAITADGCEVLSAGLPRTVEEIEACMRGEGLLQWIDRR